MKNSSGELLKTGAGPFGGGDALKAVADFRRRARPTGRSFFRRPAGSSRKSFSVNTSHDGLLQIVNLVKSPWVQVNWDTGNSYLAGIGDPYEGLQKVRDRVFHIHAKDISMAHSSKGRGKVTGTPGGCACGEGVVDWKRVAQIMEPVDRETFPSGECGKIAAAERGRAFLKKALKKYLA